MPAWSGFSPACPISCVAPPARADQRCFSTASFGSRCPERRLPGPAVKRASSPVLAASRAARSGRNGAAGTAARGPLRRHQGFGCSFSTGGPRRRAPQLQLSRPPVLSQGSCGGCWERLNLVTTFFFFFLMQSPETLCPCFQKVGTVLFQSPKGVDCISLLLPPTPRPRPPWKGLRGPASFSQRLLCAGRWPQARCCDPFGPCGSLCDRCSCRPTSGTRKLWPWRGVPTTM